MKKIYKILIIILLFLVIIGLGIYFIFIYEQPYPYSSETKYITLSDDGSTVDDGIVVNGNSVLIKSGGTYEITGSLSDGNIIVDSTNDYDVYLVFNNVSIKSSDGPALLVKEAKNTYIVLKENSLNYLEDKTSTEDYNAALFSKDDLIIQGTGELNVTANYEDGIVSKDDLVIESGTINITSSDDGIRGKDSALINGGTINISAGGDGIKSTNADDTDVGYIQINGGSFTIDAALDGIQAESTLTINDGSFDIITGSGATLKSTNDGWGSWGTTNSASAKGLKATDIIIAGGTFNINSSDDSIHANGNITINNITANIKSGDDGMHADTSITIKNGTIDITQSYEGIESSNITIDNGTIHVIASDDGINVAGGNDSSSMNRPGQNNMNSSNNQTLTINDGYIYVDATGDGLDANGSIYLNGGTVIVNGPTNDGNGALDYDYEFIVKDGLLISAGSSGMLQTPSSNSSLYSISIVFSSSITKTIYITDSNGNEVITFKPSKTIKSLVVTSDKLKKGETYNIYLVDNISTSNTDGIYNGIGSATKTLYDTITITDIVTSLGSASNNMMRR